MVNWFVDRGIIDRSRDPWRFIPARLKETPLPATLQHLLLTRLTSLNDAQRAVLQRGAIFGRNFWAGGLAALGVSEPDVMLQPLQPRGFVEAQPESSFEGETEWSFHHTLLRDVTYESVLKRERAALHKAAAAWLEEQASRAGRLEEFAGLLGEHAERAGEMTAAADWYLHAGQRAKAQGATAEARKFFDRALELLPPIDRERRWQVLLEREGVLATLGQPDAWRADLASLLELADNFDDDHRRAEVYHRQAEYGRRTGDYRAGLRAVDEALAAARRAGSQGIEVQALAIKAFLLTRLGEMETAGPAAEEALRRARELGDDAALALTLARTSVYYMELGDIGQAHDLTLRQIEITHNLGDRAQEASATANLGVGYAYLGMYKQSRAMLERGLEVSDAVGARRARAYALYNLGDVRLRTGDGRGARQLFDRAMIDMVAVNDTFGRAAVVESIGLALEQVGDASGAARRFEEARGTFADLGARAMAMECQAGLARCVLAQGRPDQARAYAGEIWTYLQQYGIKSMSSPILVYQTCAEVFDALGEPERAREAVEVAYRELMNLLGRINNPEWRTAFLENIAEHRAIVELWERLPADRA
jgi:tetratricopeptide (TPR) repeat protein